MKTKSRFGGIGKTSQWVDMIRILLLKDVVSLQYLLGDVVFFNPKDYLQHGKSLASVRAGNVIGGGDWAIDRIIPDCIRAIENELPIDIRSPHSIRPWQHVLEPLSGYMLLAQKNVECTN